MLSELYSDGALQMSRDLSFAVLQGMCVGGSTVVNNAVCIEAPDRDASNAGTREDSLKAGLDKHDLHAIVRPHGESLRNMNDRGNVHATGR